MAEKLYAIVKFIEEEDAVGVVSSVWISSDKSTCYYPDRSTSEVIQKFVRNHKVPMIDWKVCPVKVIKEYETYSEARGSLKKAEDTSNLDSEPEEYKKRKRRPRLLSDDSGDEVFPLPKKTKISTYPSIELFNAPLNSIENIPSTSSTPRTSPSISPAFRPPLANTIDSPLSLSLVSPTGNVTHHRSSAPSTSVMNSPVYRPHLAQTIESPLSQSLISPIENNRKEISLLLQMQATIADVVQEMRIMHKKIDLISGTTLQENGEISREMDVLSRFPLATMEDFLLNENNLQDPSFLNLLVKIIVSLGGRDFRGHVYNVMKKVLTDDLANLFSFSGKAAKSKEKQKKIAFGDSELYKCILVAMKTAYAGCKEDDLKLSISLWLQQSKQRATKKTGDSRKTVSES